MNLQNVCQILNEKVKLPLRQSFKYFKVQNGGEYLWFDDSAGGMLLYYEIVISYPDFVVSVGPRSGDKVSTNHRDIDSLITKCQELVDSINR